MSYFFRPLLMSLVALTLLGSWAGAAQFKGEITLRRKLSTSDLSPSLRKAIAAHSLSLGVNFENLQIEDLVKMKAETFREDHPNEYADLFRYLNRYHLRMGLNEVEIEHYRRSGSSRLPETNPAPHEAAPEEPIEDVSALGEAYNAARDGFLVSPVSGVSEELTEKLKQIEIITFRDLLEVKKLNQLSTLNLSEQHRFELHRLVRKLHQAMQAIVTQHAKLCSGILTSIRRDRKAISSQPSIYD